MAEVLQAPAIRIVLDVCWSVVIKYRDSYHAEQDPLKTWCLIPACMALALPLHASLEDGCIFSYVWICHMYWDVFGLAPLPIAHIVAAATLSRMIDLWFCFLVYASFCPQPYWFGRL